MLKKSASSSSVRILFKTYSIYSIKTIDIFCLQRLILVSSSLSLVCISRNYLFYLENLFTSHTISLMLGNTFADKYNTLYILVFLFITCLSVRDFPIPELPTMNSTRNWFFLLMMNCLRCSSMRAIYLFLRDNDP